MEPQKLLKKLTCQVETCCVTVQTDQTVSYYCEATNHLSQAIVNGTGTDCQPICETAFINAKHKSEQDLMGAATAWMNDRRDECDETPVE